LTILLNTLLFSNNLFDISKIELGEIKFQTKTKMRILNNKITKFNLPIKIHSHTEAVKKQKQAIVERVPLLLTLLL